MKCRDCKRLKLLREKIKKLREQNIELEDELDEEFETHRTEWV